MLHDGVAESGGGMLIDGFGGQKIIGVSEFCIPMMNMGSNEEPIAIDFGGVGGVDGMEVVGKEFWDDPVWVWLIGRDECTDKLRIILKIGLGEMV